MIQRIQSLFLFLASCGFLGQFGTDFATSNMPIPALMSDSIYEVQDNTVLLILTVGGALAAIASILLYNNRALQLKITILTLILSIFLPAVAFLLIYNERTAMVQGGVITDKLGAYLPFLSIICAALAMRFIKKDDNLVRSMDRLR